MRITQDDFKEVFRQVMTHGLSISETSVLPIDSTGFMGKVYTAKMSDGEVVINIIKNPVQEQVFQRVPQKIKAVTAILEDIEQVPRVFLEGSLGKNGYFIIQEKKEGSPLGVRLYENKKFIDKILVKNSNQYLEQLQDIILKIHSHTSSYFGYPYVTPEASWEQFLMKNSERCISSLEASEIDYFADISAPDLRIRLQEIIAQFPSSFSIEKSSLIHGDIFNYSNVLVHEDEVSAVVDFEWSLWGHPAWEFVFSENPSFDSYLPKAIEQGILPAGIDFKKSINLHTIFWCLWGASVHAHNKEFGPALFQVMKDKLLLI